MDKMNQNFLWGDLDSRKRLHLKNWDTVTKPKASGGLGIKRSHPRNLALLTKELGLSDNSTALWAITLKSKYPSTLPPSKKISLTWHTLTKANHICERGVGWLIQDGNSINFWHDNWTSWGLLQNSTHGPLNREEGSLKVCDL